MKKNSVSEIKIRDNMLKTLQLSISICYHDKKLIKNDKKSFMLIHLIYIMKIFHSNNFNKYLNKFI